MALSTWIWVEMPQFLMFFENSLSFPADAVMDSLLTQKLPYPTLIPRKISRILTSTTRRIPSIPDMKKGSNL